MLVSFECSNFVQGKMIVFMLIKNPKAEYS